MTIVVVEQRLAHAAALAEIRALLERCGAAPPVQGVALLLSYLSADGRRLICLFEAPDAEALDPVLERLEQEIERIWTAAWLQSRRAGEGALARAGAGREIVVVERHLEEPMTEEAVHALEARASWCLDLHRVVHLGSFLAADGRQMLCLYEAPDAEAVRRVGRETGITSGRAWAASCIGGAASSAAMAVAARDDRAG